MQLNLTDEQKGELLHLAGADYHLNLIVDDAQALEDTLEDELSEWSSDIVDTAFPTSSDMDETTR